MSASLTDKMEDHALESVPEADRIGWLKISWNTAGLVTTLVMLFFQRISLLCCRSQDRLDCRFISFCHR